MRLCVYWKYCDISNDCSADGGRFTFFLQLFLLSSVLISFFLLNINKKFLNITHVPIYNRTILVVLVNYLYLTQIIDIIFK